LNDCPPTWNPRGSGLNALELLPPYPDRSSRSPLTISEYEPTSPADRELLLLLLLLLLDGAVGVSDGRPDITNLLERSDAVSKDTWEQRTEDRTVPTEHQPKSQTKPRLFPVDHSLILTYPFFLVTLLIIMSTSLHSNHYHSFITHFYILALLFSISSYVVISFSPTI
jgi:hypothetical protein